jgi:hypothetical protein
VIKPLPLLLLLFQFGPTPPRGPATQLYSDYPIRVHLLVVNSQGYAGDYRGWGRGDILPTQPGAVPIGFDYVDSCGAPFFPNRLADEFYQARWKKPGQKLEILLQTIGSDHLSRCELKIAPKARPYTYPGLPSAPPATRP